MLINERGNMVFTASNLYSKNRLKSRLLCHKIQTIIKNPEQAFDVQYINLIDFLIITRPITPYI